MINFRDFVNILPITPDKRVILACKERGNGGEWIPLGGKKGSKESDLLCLRRKLQEELYIDPSDLLAMLGNLKYLWEFTGKTHARAWIKARAYSCRISFVISPRAEIQRLQNFFGQDCLEKRLTSETTKDMVQTLLSRGMLK